MRIPQPQTSSLHPRRRPQRQPRREHEPAEKQARVSRVARDDLAQCQSLVVKRRYFRPHVPIHHAVQGLRPDVSRVRRAAIVCDRLVHHLHHVPAVCLRRVGEVSMVIEVGPRQRHRQCADRLEWRKEPGPSLEARLSVEAFHQLTVRIVKHLVAQLLGILQIQAFEVERQLLDASGAVLPENPLAQVCVSTLFGFHQPLIDQACELERRGHRISPAGEVGAGTRHQQGEPAIEQRSHIAIRHDVTQEVLGLRAGGGWFVLRTHLDPASFAQSAPALVSRNDPNQSYLDVRAMTDRIKDGIWQQRTAGALFLGFAAIAALLATVGLYSVLSYLVSQQQRELGVRIALGAQRWDVLRLVIGRGLRLTLIGLALGLVCAVPLARLVGSLLYGVSPFDPVTFLGVPMILTLLATVACYLPARRAMTTDPIIALRAE